MECSIDELRRLFRYEPETGDLIRLVTVSWNAVSGDVAGMKHRNRMTHYKRVCVNGKVIYAHRIAWAMSYGNWPENQIDHVDGDGLNNRIENLRDSTHTQNQRNQRLHRRNSSGVRGVSRCKDRWLALIWFEGKRIHLGRHSTIEAAAAARKSGEEKYWGSAR